MVAPSWDASGASVSLTSVESGCRMSMEPRRLVDAPDVEPTPSRQRRDYITWAAITGAFGAPPDLVLSGINQGPNTGRAVLHSGTVGAALTACAHASWPPPRRSTAERRLGHRGGPWSSCRTTPKSAGYPPADAGPGTCSTTAKMTCQPVRDPQSGRGEWTVPIKETGLYRIFIDGSPIKGNRLGWDTT